MPERISFVMMQRNVHIFYQIIVFNFIPWNENKKKRLVEICICWWSEKYKSQLIKYANNESNNICEWVAQPGISFLIWHRIREMHGNAKSEQRNSFYFFFGSSTTYTNKNTRRRNVRSIFALRDFRIEGVRKRENNWTKVKKKKSYKCHNQYSRMVFSCLW